MNAHSTIAERSSLTAAAALAFAMLFAAGPAFAVKAPVNPAVSAHPQGYLGVDIRDISEERVSVLHLKEAHGAEIVHVDHDGPAGKAGLRTGDVIVQINSAAIDGEESLRRMLRETAPGRTVTILLSRDGQMLTIVTALANREEVERQSWQQHLTVPEPQPYPQPPLSQASTTTAIPNSPRSPEANSFMAQAPANARSKSSSGNMLISPSFTGATLEMLGPQLAEFFGVTSAAAQAGPAFSTGLPSSGTATSGLLVRSVEPNTPAAAAGLRAGDIVMRANQTAVNTGADWLRMIHDNRGHAIALMIMRDKVSLTLTIIPDGKHRAMASPLELPFWQRGLSGSLMACLSFRH